MHVHMQICAHIHVHLYASKHVHLSLSLSLYIFIDTNAGLLCTCICIYTCGYVYIYIQPMDRYVYMSVYIYIYTHISICMCVHASINFTHFCILHFYRRSGAHIAPKFVTSCCFKGRCMDKILPKQPFCADLVSNLWRFRQKQRPELFLAQPDGGVGRNACLLRSITRLQITMGPRLNRRWDRNETPYPDKQVVFQQGSSAQTTWHASSMCQNKNIHTSWRAQAVHKAGNPNSKACRLRPVNQDPQVIGESIYRRL